MGHHSSELLVGFPAIKCPLNISSNRNVIDKIEDIEAPNDIIKFPHSPLCSIFSLIGAEFSDNNALCGCFQGKRDQNSLNIRPFCNNQRLLDFTNWLQQVILVMTEIIESIEPIFRPSP